VRRRIVDKFWWWNLDDLADEGFFDMIVREGANNLRLEFRPREERSLVLVNRETGEQCGDYDISHVCPPQCP
jgi:hypothetical protein